MRKDFETKNYGTVEVKSVMKVDFNNLIEGIEIIGEEIGVIPIPLTFAIEDVTTEEVESMINKYI